MELDYKGLGFRCGLEIHQRLSSKNKLFCSCSARIVDQSDDEDIKGDIMRHQRAVAGELGSVDASAEFEQIRGREFLYHIYDENTCLVDIDEEPPHDMDMEALHIALSMASALSMSPIYEIQPMRKGVVDGSNPSAFQRTTLIGVDGVLDIDGKEIKIPAISLEEESAGIISKTKTEMERSIVRYSTQRVGIPLIEIDTDSYIESPEMARSVAIHIGTLLRITGNVQRGIGSIRQDVNVSIRDGARVEIKGLQELSMLHRFVENEVLRQVNLLSIRDELKRRGAKVYKPVDVTGALRDSSSKMVIHGLASPDGVAYGFRAKGFEGVFGREVNPDRRLGTEVSDYAKMAGVNGIIHSDEALDRYGLSDNDIKNVRKALGVVDGDAFVIVIGGESMVLNAIGMAAERARVAMMEVPKETRGVYDTKLCTTRFLRPLPTGSRMYPETDARPTVITEGMRKRAEADAPNLERSISELERVAGSREMAGRLLLSYRFGLFSSLSKNKKIDSVFLANTILQRFPELEREGYDVDSISESRLERLFVLYSNGKIAKHGVGEALKLLSKDTATNVDDIIENNKLWRISGNKLKRLVDDFKGRGGGKSGVIVGEIMKRYRLNVDGEELNDLLSS